MTTPSEPGPEQREERLAVLWKRVQRAARRGNQVRFRALSAEYEALKAEHVTASHVEQIRERRAARDAARAQEPAAPERWRLPFRKSPGAIERDRQPPEPEQPMVPPGGHLRPWRRSGSPMSERIWRP